MDYMVQALTSRSICCWEVREKRICVQERGWSCRRLKLFSITPCSIWVKPHIAPATRSTRATYIKPRLQISPVMWRGNFQKGNPCVAVLQTVPHLSLFWNSEGRRALALVPVWK